ncbi:MAG: hypothetical protein ABIH38_00905 [Patescibacteria group bacterium]
MEVTLAKGAREKQVRKALRGMGYLAKEIGQVKKIRDRRVIAVPKPVEAAIPLVCILPGVAKVCCAPGERRGTHCPFLDD